MPEGSRKEQYGKLGPGFSSLSERIYRSLRTFSPNAWLNGPRKLPSGPVVKTLRLSRAGCGFDAPRQGNKIPHAMTKPKPF